MQVGRGASQFVRAVPAPGRPPSGWDGQALGYLSLYKPPSSERHAMAADRAYERAKSLAFDARVCSSEVPKVRRATTTTTSAARLPGRRQVHEGAKDERRLRRSITAATGTPAAAARRLWGKAWRRRRRPTSGRGLHRMCAIMKWQTCAKTNTQLRQ